jgi:tetratricopeptide (TPR) repeat protein
MASSTWQRGVDLIKQGQFQEAERVLQEVVRADPLSFEGHYHLGAALAKQQRYEEAAAALKQAAQILPDHPAVHYNLGLMLERTDDLQAAASEFQTALRLAPDHPKARQRLQAIEAQRAAKVHQAVIAATPGSWTAPKSDEPTYSQEELKAADRAAAREQFLVKGAVFVSWGIGLAALFLVFSHMMSIFYGAIIVVPFLAPLIYLVALDAYDWFSVNPKLAIPVSAVGIVFSALAVIWAIRTGVLRSGL